MYQSLNKIPAFLCLYWTRTDFKRFFWDAVFWKSFYVFSNFKQSNISYFNGILKENVMSINILYIIFSIKMLSWLLHSSCWIIKLITINNVVYQIVEDKYAFLNNNYWKQVTEKILEHLLAKSERFILFIPPYTMLFKKPTSSKFNRVRKNSWYTSVWKKTSKKTNNYM